MGSERAGLVLHILPFSVSQKPSPPPRARVLCLVWQHFKCWTPTSSAHFHIDGLGRAEAGPGPGAVSPLSLWRPSPALGGSPLAPSCSPSTDGLMWVSRGGQRFCPRGGLSGASSPGLCLQISQQRPCCWAGGSKECWEKLLPHQERVGGLAEHV